ncbi:MAG: YceI family protein [Bacteroidetes bacterium]|nr:MAG: YceI family protein [Bacteroidota bacterium]
MAQTKWGLDRSHSYVNFSVSHMVISDVTGTFKDFETAVEAGKEDFSDAKINVAIKAKSIDTGNEGRDRHLRSADFFNADKDSIVTFKSTRIEKTAEGKYAITGDLTMRGVTRQVVLDAQYKGKAKNPWGKTIAAFKATGSVNRKEFGLNWNKALETGGVLVGENVDITIAVQLVQG